jgi:hypothetical protein
MPDRAAIAAEWDHVVTTIGEIPKLLSAGKVEAARAAAGASSSGSFPWTGTAGAGRRSFYRGRCRRPR